MYARTLTIENFKCFGHAALDLQYPGRKDEGASEIDNINIVVGDNGAGKSSVLRALAIAMLAPALLYSGFVPYRLVRRIKGGVPMKTARVVVEGIANDGEREWQRKSNQVLLTGEIAAPPHGGKDRILHRDSDEFEWSLLEDERSPSVFIVGYGATRRTETGDFSQSSARRSRGLRYQRIASLFEDHVALRPLQSWLPDLARKSPSTHYEQAIALIDSALPDNLRFHGAISASDEQYLFDFQDEPTPYSSLSDGYRAYIAWIGDLVGHMVDVCPPQIELSALEGIALIDEIDLHMHPEWQRKVVPKLASAFPKLQFVLTTHSPLVAATVKRRNVFVTDIDAEGLPTVNQIEESLFGRSVEDILTSSYFGLASTRPPEIQRKAEAMFGKTAAGRREAALEYLDMLGATDLEHLQGR